MNTQNRIVVVLFSVASALTILASGARSDTGSCYAIQSADARAYCLAKARGEPSMCYAIQSAPVRAQCLAEVRA